MFGLGKRKAKLKSENNIKALYFNTNNTFIEKELPVLEDGTVNYGNKTWVVADTYPYLKANDGMFSKGRVEPYYILTNESAFPITIVNDAKNKERSDKDNPLVLDELVNFRALKQMMNFTISKESGSSSEGSKVIKFVLIAGLLVGAYFVIRYVWMGAGT